MVIFFKFLFLVIPLTYILFEKRASLIVVTVLFSYFLILRVSESNPGIFNFLMRSKLYSGVKDIAREKQVSFLCMLGAVFIVANFFQKDIACFSLILSLSYIAILSFLERFSKIRLLNRPLDIMVILIPVIYFLAKYIGIYFVLENNVVNYSVLALPLIHFSLRWPEKSFSVVFFTAFTAQFIKNSF
ncbi:MAG: hypothetical protein P9L98_06415 [Candidatus Kaelpia imicola]|nr:hypothetical protein [Candidatus Kaelpia imicola]